LLLEETKILNEKQEIQRLWSESTIVIKENSSRIEIDPNGNVRLLADNESTLRKLRSVVEISMRASSRWNYSLSLQSGRITNQQTGKPVDPIPIAIISIYSQIDGRLLENIAGHLAASDEMVLSFLRLATSLMESHVELAILTALTALELSISEVVKSDDLQTSGRIAVLAFTKALPPDDIAKLKSLWTIRNKLAHGVWTGEELGLAVSGLLGGSPKEWLEEDSGRIDTEACKKIMWQITYGIQLLSGKTGVDARKPPLTPESVEKMTGIVTLGKSGSKSTSKQGRHQSKN